MRHAKQLTAKSRQHLITRLSPFSYRLTSGSSGNQYIVNIRSDGSCSCNCKWGQTRPSNDKRSLCSHSLAILSYVKSMEEERRVNCYGSMDEARKNHRQIISQFDGGIVTARKS